MSSFRSGTSNGSATAWWRQTPRRCYRCVQALPRTRNRRRGGAMAIIAATRPVIQQAAMPDHKRKLAFVLAASDHGAMIVSRLDYRMLSATQGIGVGHQILESGAFDAGEISMALSILELR